MEISGRGRELRMRLSGELRRQLSGELRGELGGELRGRWRRRRVVEVLQRLQRLELVGVELLVLRL